MSAAITIVGLGPGQWSDLTLQARAVLAQAAQDAVKEWVYKPTLLNGEPVEVVTQIDCNFTLRDTPPAAAQPQL